MYSGKNWKTTLAGAATVLIPVLNAVVPVLPPQYAAILAGITAGIGLLFAKDANVTGGDVKQ
jgi:hypothetical protein